MEESSFTIIENTEEAQAAYGYCYGANYCGITREDIEALLNR